MQPSTAVISTYNIANSNLMWLKRNEPLHNLFFNIKLEKAMQKIYTHSELIIKGIIVVLIGLIVYSITLV